MKKLLASGIAFVRENPRILYSLILVVLVPAAFFLNTYGIISRVEKDIDRITQRKAVLAEKIINDLVAGKISDQSALQLAIDTLMEDNEEILSLAILLPEEDPSRFRVVASSEPADLEQTTDDLQYLLAWNKSEGIAFLEQDETGRLWRVTRQLTDGTTEEKIGLVTVTFSLRDTDALLNKTINRSYLILAITIVVVLLIVSNQARLFGYVLTLNKLKEIDQMKDTFISMASHELKAPLTAIRGYLEFLGEKMSSADEESKHYLTNITSSVNRLQTLVMDILDVSKLEGNRIPITLSTFDPTELISQSLEELRSQAIQKNLELKWEPGPSATVSADTERLKQVVVNLVGNAIKYTEKGSVTVTTKTKDKEYLITVADTGFGISAADQAKLFQKFSRIQTDKTKNISGTGLGLWITFELARRMGGSITVESIEGVGSHFTVHLPLAKVK